MAVSRDGWIATGSWDRSVKLWDAATGTLRHTFPDRGGPGLAGAISLDGRRLVSATGWMSPVDGLEVNSRQEPIPFQRGAKIWSAAFSPDGKRIVTGSGDHMIKVWDAASKEQVAKWQKEDRTAAAVKQAAVNPR